MRHLSRRATGGLRLRLTLILLASSISLLSGVCLASEPLPLPLTSPETVELPKAELVALFDLIDTQSAQIAELAAREQILLQADGISPKCDRSLGWTLGALAAGVVVGVLIE